MFFLTGSGLMLRETPVSSILAMSVSKALPTPCRSQAQRFQPSVFPRWEGPVENNTFLSLDAEGADEIWASVDGGKAFQLIDAGILLDNLLDDGSETTVSAYAVKDGKKGNTVTKTYTKAGGSSLPICRSI